MSEPWLRRLRFVEARDGRGEGLGGIDLAAVDPGRALRSAEARGVPVEDDQITICGTRVRLVGAPGAGSRAALQ